VGIGASAGGLQALERFLRQVPPGSGLGLVVIQHLNPAAKDLLPQLLQRRVSLPVHRIRDGVAVEPDQVYVIPPGWDLTLDGPALRLSRPARSGGRHLPVDRFLISLARERGARAVGVVLSGMGSDGTAGLRAIRDRGGLCVVQDPADAQFDGMPRSALEAGLADRVGPAETLPALILANLRPGGRESAAAEPGQEPLACILAILQQRTGQDFGVYKTRTLLSRIRRRLGLHRLDGYGAYADYLERNPEETELLAKELVIGVTRFFRDPPVWQAMIDRVLPDTLRARPGRGAFRAWVAGCSTGEEAYSLAIAYREALDRLDPSGHPGLQLFATDLDPDAVDRARKGLFPDAIAQDVGPDRLAACFTAEPEGYRVAQAIRSPIVFARHDLVRDPPIRHLDLLCCRNLLIYLRPQVQRQLLQLFHQALEPGGVLCLGTSESIGGLDHLFEPLEARNRIFRRLGLAGKATQLPPAFGRPAPQPRPDPAPAGAPSLAALAAQALLRQFGPPAVLVNDAGDILYQHGAIEPFLEPPAGRTNWNLFAMATGPLRVELARTLLQSAREGAPGFRSLALERAGLPLELTLQRLGPETGLSGFTLVAFRLPGAGGLQAPEGDLPPPPESPQDPLALQQELRALRLAKVSERRLLHAAQQEMSTIREEFRSSREELQSTNEELLSANENLLAANEELSLSHAELQALNEHCRITQVRQEVQAEALERSCWEQDELLEATTALLLGQDLRVRRCTPRAAALFNLLPDDLGRPLTHLAGPLDYPALAGDAEEVLRTLAPRERLAPTRDGRLFCARLRPYVSREHRIEGLVLALADVTATARMERTLREAMARLTPLLDLVPGPCALATLLPGPGGRPWDARLERANPAFARRFPHPPAPLGELTLLGLLPGLAPQWPVLAAWAEGWESTGLPVPSLGLEAAGFQMVVQPLAGSELLFIFNNATPP
jgi:two-component system CheB/CheR fusion protein